MHTECSSIQRNIWTRLKFYSETANNSTLLIIKEIKRKVHKLYSLRLSRDETVLNKIIFYK